MKDDGGQSKETFEERLEALFRERYGAIVGDLSPEETKVLLARFGVKRGMYADEEDRALNEMAKELSRLKKKH